MATIVGNNGAISVNAKAVAAVKSFSIDMKADTIETTTMGQEVRTYIKGLSSFTGSADIYWDYSDWDTAGENTTWNPTDGSSLVGASGVTGRFYIDFDNIGTNADKAFTGNVIVTGYSIKSSMDGMVEATISFQGSDSIIYSTTNITYP